MKQSSAARFVGKLLLNVNSEYVTDKQLSLTQMIVNGGNHVFQLRKHTKDKRNHVLMDIIAHNFFGCIYNDD